MNSQVADPLSLIIGTDRGAILHYARQYNRSLEQFHAVSELEPKFARGHVVLWVYVEKGMYKEATEDLERWQRDFPGIVWGEAWTAYVFSRTGESNPRSTCPAETSRTS